ncbi:MAG: glutaredoxin 3 [Gammaproteobacteria bacterium]|nr:glutaredoxin 3 [Gammaproteobacteria bacterium]
MSDAKNSSSTAEVVIYGKNNCPYCDHAKNFLTEQNIPFTYYNTSEDTGKLEEMRNKTNGRTFPQIFIDGKNIEGGYTGMMKLHESGELQKMLDWWK